MLQDPSPDSFDPKFTQQKLDESKCVHLLMIQYSFGNNNQTFLLVRLFK